MYDIYLNRSFNTLPELSDIVQETSLVDVPALQAHLLRRGQAPGVLGLEIPRALALQLVKRFEEVQKVETGYIFPVAYHHPHLSIEEAIPIAADAIENIRFEHDPTDKIGPVFFNNEYPCYWEFGAVSERRTRERWIPNGWFALVDKLDGHIWQYEDINRLFRGEIF